MEPRLQLALSYRARFTIIRVWNCVVVVVVGIIPGEIEADDAGVVNGHSPVALVVTLDWTGDDLAAFAAD